MIAGISRSYIESNAYLSQPIACATKRPIKTRRVVPNDDALNRSVGPCGKKEEADQNKNDVDQKASNASYAARGDPARAVISLSHTHVRHAPEDEAEE